MLCVSLDMLKQRLVAFDPVEQAHYTLTHRYTGVPTQLIGRFAYVANVNALVTWSPISIRYRHWPAE